MHVAIIMDNDRLMHEHVMLKRLSIGLIDEGVRLTRVLPDDIEAEPVLSSERRLALVARAEVPLKVLPWQRSRRAEELAAAMERALPDVIYAVGRDTWPVAIDLADAIDRPIAIDVWSSELAEHAPRKRAARNIGGYVVPTAPLAALLRHRVDPDLVSLVPMGVAIASKPRRGSSSERQESITAAIIGSGRDLPAYRGVLSALQKISRDVPQLQIVLELRGPHEHEIWRQMDRCGLHPIVSPIRDASLHRALITRCDVLIVPECYGEVDSLLLDCMAVGMAIVAREDPILDMLEDNTTAILLPQDDLDPWEGKLRRVLSDTALARRLGAAAHDVAARRHGSSKHVGRLIETFEKIVSGESYAFVRQLP